MTATLKKWKVDLWSDTSGDKPATVTSVVVEAHDKASAVLRARSYVREKHPDINPMKLDTWFTEEVLD